jgi:hypothetical protein
LRAAPNDEFLYIYRPDFPSVGEANSFRVLSASGDAIGTEAHPEIKIVEDTAIAIIIFFNILIFVP